MSPFASDIIRSLVTVGLITAVAVYLIICVVLFIRDGIQAKKEQRKRKTGITVMFVISMALFLVVGGGMLFLSILAAAIMRGM